MDKTGALPWRMSTHDHQVAWQDKAVGPEPGRTTEAPWDPILADLLRHRREAIVEERVAEVLLDDLAEHRGREW
jgi:hypothetical protein